MELNDCRRDLFKKVANDFAAEFGDQIDEGTLSDFNWGDFVDLISDDFLERYGIALAPSSSEANTSVTLFVHHDELILGDEFDD